MGNWDVLHHLFECPSEARAEAVYQRLCAAEEHDWIDNRWGLRLGFVSPTLVVASTSQKYGWDREFSDFAIDTATDIALTQLISDSEDKPDVCAPLCSASRAFQIQWDYLFWHSREEIHWHASPVRTVAHAPPDDVGRRLTGAIPDLNRVGQSELLFRLSEHAEPMRAQDGGPSSEHKDAIRSGFSGIYNIGPQIEDVACIVFGALSKEHGAVNFGYLGIEDDRADFTLTLGSNLLNREVWLGPYTQPIRDELLFAPEAVEFELMCLTRPGSRQQA